MKKRVLLYLHISKDSLVSTQEQVLREYCKRKDWQIVRVSSNFDEVLESIKSNEVDIVLVDTIERLGENKCIFADHNVELVSIVKDKDIKGMN